MKAEKGEARSGKAPREGRATGRRTKHEEHLPPWASSMVGRRAWVHGWESGEYSNAHGRLLSDAFEGSGKEAPPHWLPRLHL